MAEAATDLAQNYLNKAIEVLDAEVKKNPSLAGHYKEQRENLVKRRDAAWGVMQAVQARGQAEETKKQNDFENPRNNPLVKSVEDRTAELSRQLSDNLLTADMSAQQQIDALTEQKRNLESLQAAREAELKAMRDAGQVEEAARLENSKAWVAQGNLLSKEIQETQKLIDGNTKTVEASRKDTEETLRSQMQRLTEERRTTKQGSAEWTDLGNRISEIIKKQAEFDLDNMDKEIAETKDSGRLATLTAKREERVKMLNADLDRVWDLREGGSGPSLAGAVSGAKNALADTIDSWRDALQSAKDTRDNEIAKAQDALKIFDEKIENAERTGKYSDFDIQYAKRETRKGTELASLQTEAAGRRDYANAIRAQGLETAKALNESIAWYDQERKSAKTDGERIAATKEWTAARTQLMAVTREVSTAEREAESIAGRLAAAMGQSTISTIELSDAIRTSIKWYLEDNDGNLGMVDYFKTNLPNAVGSAGGALSKFFRDTASGTVSVADGFRAMAGSIIESLLDIAAQYAAMAIFKSILGLLGGPDLLPDGSSITTDLPIFAPKPRNSGGPTMAAAGRLVGGQGARDTQLFGLTPGEYVLRKSAVDAVGVDTLDRINALGSSTISAARPQAMMQARAEPDVTNIYVVPPEQKPSLTKKDVLINMQEFLQVDGTTKQLVRQISRGVG